MNRRHFLTLSGTAASLAALAPITTATAANGSGRDFYELRSFTLDKEDQKKILDNFFKNALIPALNRLGSKPVGVFYPAEGMSPIYLLVRYSSMQQAASLQAELAQDSEFVANAEEFLSAPVDAPAYKRMESSLFLAFEGMPRLETPAKDKGRVFQLRIYESPSVMAGLKKIEMFNDAGEIRLFREVGLNPVFFGQALIGSKMPNLTYMLGFNSMAEQKAAWQKFIAHPEWKKLSKMPEYADKTILSGITNINLVAAEYSQV